jgi:hypothetical protein
VRRRVHLLRIPSECPEKEIHQRRVRALQRPLVTTARASQRPKINDVLRCARWHRRRHAGLEIAAIRATT